MDRLLSCVLLGFVHCGVARRDPLKCHKLLNGMHCLSFWCNKSLDVAGSRTLDPCDKMWRRRRHWRGVPYQQRKGEEGVTCLRLLGFAGTCPTWKPSGAALGLRFQLPLPRAACCSLCCLRQQPLTQRLGWGHREWSKKKKKRRGVWGGNAWHLCSCRQEFPEDPSFLWNGSLLTWQWPAHVQPAQVKGSEERKFFLLQCPYGAKNSLLGQIGPQLPRQWHVNPCQPGPCSSHLLSLDPSTAAELRSKAMALL